MISETSCPRLLRTNILFANIKHQITRQPPIWRFGFVRQKRKNIFFISPNPKQSVEKARLYRAFSHICGINKSGDEQDGKAKRKPKTGGNIKEGAPPGISAKENRHCHEFYTYIRIQRKSYTATNKQISHFQPWAIASNTDMPKKTTEKIFCRILSEIERAGYPSPEAVFTDGTHMKSNANIKKAAKKRCRRLPGYMKIWKTTDEEN